LKEVFNNIKYDTKGRVKGMKMKEKNRHVPGEIKTTEMIKHAVRLS